MDTENYQRELFEFDKPKRSFLRLRNIFPKADFEGKIIFSFTLEKIIFIAIATLMLMVVIFALGVESGKQSALRIQVAKVQAPTPVKAVSPQPAVRAAAAPQVIRTEITNGKPYIIIAGSFNKKEYALQEVNKLRAQGYEAYMTQSNSYFKVCVGYLDKSLADKMLVKIKRSYKDAYIKSR